jgi:hypothetical protein
VNVIKKFVREMSEEVLAQKVVANKVACEFLAPPTQSGSKRRQANGKGLFQVVETKVVVGLS